MARFKYGWVLGLALAILPVSAFAASKSNTKDIQLSEASTVAGTQLSPGEYKLQWDKTDSDSANVTFYRGKEAVATVPARIVREKNTTNATFQFSSANGGNTLQRVYLKDEILEFEQDGTMGGN
jgi:hypothetical protein